MTLRQGTCFAVVVPILVVMSTTTGSRLLGMNDLLVSGWPQWEFTRIVNATVVDRSLVGVGGLDASAPT